MGINLFANRQRWLWLAVYAAIFLLAVLLINSAVIPAYTSPNSRLWSTRIGYPAVLRRIGKPIPVETEAPRVQSMSKVISGVGSMAYLNEVPINVEIQGAVAAVLVESGQHVEPGNVLFLLDSGGRSTRIGSLDVEANQRAYDKAGKDYVREKEAYDGGLIAKSDLIKFETNLDQARINLKKSKEQLALSTESQSKLIFGSHVSDPKLYPKHKKSLIEIVSPIRGSVSRVDTFVGENIINSSKPVMWVGDNLIFKTAIDQRYFPEIKIGDNASVYIYAYGNKMVQGKVIKIDSAVSRLQKLDDITPPYTFSVWLSLDQQNDSKAPLIPGMNGYSRFEYPFKSLAISEKSLLRYSGKTGVVMILNKNDKIELREVNYSVGDQGMVAIESGLSEDDRVVVSGQIGLKPGDMVKLQDRK
jgi:multidrug efflux pump subunit AcrA (membrane-fusion protein)